ncbi:MAG TPA: hypothetical protein VLJ10_05565 [Candidatus Bathyarchaeia archaeon]|nr:hypothetical protein [Candidatus Bathyarchaeia archaeon]
MKYQLQSVMMVGIVFLMVSPGQAQDTAVGTESPASYKGVKQQVMDLAHRRQRSQTIQDVAMVYREMVSSFKAKQIVHAEEMSQRLDELLADPILPDSFVKKMQAKHERFLKRVYGPLDLADVPEDETISEADFAAIQQEARQKSVRRVAPQSTAVEMTNDPVVSDQPESRPQILEKPQPKIKTVSQAKKPDRMLRETASVAAQAEPAAVDASVSTEAKRAQRIEKSLASAASAGYQMTPEEVKHYLALYQEERQKKVEELKKEFERKVDILYSDGVEFYKKNAYRFAYDILNEVEKVKPDYKMTRQYLSELRHYFELVEEEKPSTKIMNEDRQEFIGEELDQYVTEVPDERKRGDQ